MTTAAMPAAYDPRYDPLVARHPGQGSDYAPTYWVATAGEPPADDGPVTGDLDADVVIVGAGFTGLATALFLAREHGIRATVLEANRVAWGCTSRNGGQGQNASGRLYRSQWIARWGRPTALALDAEIRAGFETFRSLVAEIPCDAQPGGHLYIAHRERKMAFLRAEAALMREVFGYDTAILDREAVRRDYVDDAEACGAMHESEGIGVHPLKLAFGYQRLARALGVKIHTASPVTSMRSVGDVHHLATPGGTVRARAVAFATGGYTSPGLHRSVEAKLMPILSNSLVTAPLTAAQLEATGFRTHQFITDTRTLRHYYRRLPDDRVQIGSRSAITGADAPHPRHLELLVAGLHRKFPALRGIAIDHAWWGWVDVSHDMMPRIVQPDPRTTLYYALGYGGNGVSFSGHAGRRLAERIAGRAAPSLPIYDTPLEYPNVLGVVRSRHFAPYRRLGQRILYRWYQLQDERR
ncbi:MAG: FAD-binding oxidoreductase [Burkholderiales bacterium]|nr:FAD-binding oxidoreductase [Burkholderiales bacterium]MDE1927124.1 FAD-binding oxidoreductase [Burkholderiales bacterium]MDE2159256.1 FAD-binding oxidoreductase [Burkholderiales bacterium]MDE2503644.1 FAD-binding oxidoreductase [Burkholderiales bacterium]